MKPTKFKKGDRVTAITNYSRPDRQEYVLAADVEKPEKWVTADVKTLEGRVTQVWSDSLRLVEPEPYTPKVGDKVRVTYEGVVKHVYKPDGALDLESGQYVSAGGVVELLEKAPKPFPVGTMAGWENGSHFVVKLADGWRWRFGGDGPAKRLTDEQVRGFVESEPNFNILYEPTTP